MFGPQHLIRPGQHEQSPHWPSQACPHSCFLDAGAVSSLERDGKLAWFTEPKELVPGQKVRLLYNAQSGCLSNMTPLPSPPTVILGFNGWLDTQVGMDPDALGVGIRA